MSDKALTNVELELTQRIQVHFPRGVVPSQTITLWNSCPKEVLSAKLAEVFGRVPEVASEPNLLLEIGTVTLPATAEQFVAKNRFVVNTNDDALVKISYLGNSFKEWFLDGEGQVENPAGEQTFRYAKLCRLSVDNPIITELGGEARAETTLAAMFTLMEKQGHGQNGALLTNGYANIFYVKDIAGILRAVGVDCDGDGWSVGTDSVEYLGRWDDGDQVFSRN